MCAAIRSTGLRWILNFDLLVGLSFCIVHSYSSLINLTRKRVHSGLQKSPRRYLKPHSKAPTSYGQPEVLGLCPTNLPSIHPYARSKCAFQLDKFLWSGVGSGQALYTVSLSRQHSILHVKIDIKANNARSTLPDRLCPSLISVACSLSGMARSIIALRLPSTLTDPDDWPASEILMSAAERERCITALKKIQYLQVWWELPLLPRYTGGVRLHNVTVLQVRYWEIKV